MLGHVWSYIKRSLDLECTSCRKFLWWQQWHPYTDDVYCPDCFAKYYTCSICETYVVGPGSELACQWQDLEWVCSGCKHELGGLNPDDTVTCRRCGQSDKKRNLCPQ